MTTPGVPVSPGLPLLEGPARDAIHAARSRMEALTRGSLPFPVKDLSEKEKEEALKGAADATCQLCGGIHPAPNTPACPRIATFKLNGDGKLTEGSFWPDGGHESVVETDGDGNVRSVVYRTRSEWPTDRVVFPSELAEEGEEAGEGGAHPA